MKLLKYEDVVKAVDEHTNDDGQLDDDITCILEEVPAAKPLISNWKNGFRKKLMTHKENGIHMLWKKRYRKEMHI